MKSILIAIGLVCIIEGMPYFCFPDKVKGIALKVQEIDSKILRVFGIILMCLGLALVYLVRGFLK